MEKSNTEAKVIASMALIIKLREQIDSLIAEEKDVRYSHWQNNLYTMFEDMEDKLPELKNSKK